YRPVLWPVITYVALVVPFMPVQELAIGGWYRLPILPLMLIGAAGALYAAVREGQLLVPALALLSAGLWSLQWLFTFPWQPGAITLLLLAAVALVPVAVAEVVPRGRWRDAGQGIWALLAILILAGDTVLSYNLALHLSQLG